MISSSKNNPFGYQTKVGVKNTAQQNGIYYYTLADWYGHQNNMIKAYVGSSYKYLTDGKS